jgi:cytoskeletal protein CcmA (bactofilin family)
MSNGTTAAVVGEDAQFSGRFTGQDLTVFGRLEGEVELKGRLRIGKQGRVKAKVKAASTEIEGDFEGEVRTDALTLAETAKARGTFVAKRLNVREGAVLEGSVNPTAGAVATPVSATPPAPAPAAAGPGPANAGHGATATSDGAHEAKPEDGGKTP